MSETKITPEVPSTATSIALPDQVEPAGAATAPGGKAEQRGAHRDAEKSRHTRISGAWAAVFAGVVLGVALIDFIVENTRSVRVDFFSANGRMPVAVALLAAAIAGAAVVLAVGVCRTAQLRLSLRRHRRETSVGPASTHETVTTEGSRR